MDNLIEDKKVIATFMGWKNSLESATDEYCRWYNPNGDFGVMYLPEDLNYDTSWDWLMPVIDKIEELNFRVTLQPYQCQIFDNSKPYPENFIIDADFHDDKLINAFEGVVTFIKWYNETKKIKRKL